MNQAVNDIDRIIGSVLDLSRPLQLRRKDHKISTIMDSIEDFVLSLNRDVEFKVECNRPEAIIFTDRYYLKSAVIHLLNNAFEVSPLKSVVSLNIQIDADYVQFVVTDQGPGIPIDQQEKIFLPLFTNKQSGNGFGLPMVRKICEHLGGQVRLIKTYEGACFQIQLPNK